MQMAPQEQGLRPGVTVPSPSPDLRASSSTGEPDPTRGGWEYMRTEEEVQARVGMQALQVGE